MTEYAVRYRDRKGRESLLSERHPSPEACHARIRRLINAWEREATIIQHHPGLSFAWFADGTCIEAWRAGQSGLTGQTTVEGSQ